MGAHYISFAQVPKTLATPLDRRTDGQTDRQTDTHTKMAYTALAKLVYSYIFFAKKCK